MSSAPGGPNGYTAPPGRLHKASTFSLARSWRFGRPPNPTENNVRVHVCMCAVVCVSCLALLACLFLCLFFARLFDWLVVCLFVGRGLFACPGGEVFAFFFFGWSLPEKPRLRSRKNIPHRPPPPPKKKKNSGKRCFAGLSFSAPP